MLKNIKVMNFKLKKIQDILFFLIVFCVIFDYMPKAMWLTFFGLGGPYSAMLGNYPIIAGFLLTVYMTWNGYISIWNRYVALFFVIWFIFFYLGMCIRNNRIIITITVPLSINVFCNNIS